MEHVKLQFYVHYCAVIPMSHIGVPGNSFEMLCSELNQVVQENNNTVSAGKAWENLINPKSHDHIEQQ